MAEPKLEVSYVPTSELVPYANNAKEHTDAQIDQICASIREFGNCDPVGVWHDEGGTPIIVEGHGRVLALKRLGAETVPVISLDHLSDEQRREYALVHNQLTMNTGWDEDVLAREMEKLADFDWAAMGFGEDEAMEALEEWESASEDHVPEPPKEPRAKRGELWRLGDHFLLCGDSTNVEDVANLLRGGVVDLLVTDPPYNVDYHGAAGSIENDAFADEDAFRAFVADALTAAASHMRPGAAFYVWYASTHAPSLYAAARDAGLSVRQELEWVKNHFTLGRQDYQWRHEPCLYGWKEGAAHFFAQTRCESNVIEDEETLDSMGEDELRELARELLGAIPSTVLRYDKPLASADHPTMKPVRLIAHLIRNSSRPGESVYDPFLGSGTTLIACEQMGRRCYGMEIDPAYCDVIIRRWEDLTGKSAERVA